MGRIGFSSGVNLGLFAGEIWLLLHRLEEKVVVYANGTTSQLLDMLLPGLQSVHRALLSYEHSTGVIRAFVDGELLLEDDLDDYSFTPNIGAAGFQMNKPRAGQTFVDDFRVNRSAEVFADGFESGDTSNWIAFP